METCYRYTNDGKLTHKNCFYYTRKSNEKLYKNKQYCVDLSVIIQKILI